MAERVRIPPSRAKARREGPGSNGFEAVARERHDIKQDSWTENHAGYVLRRLEADASPSLGTRPVAEIMAADVLDALRKVERHGARDLGKRPAKSSCLTRFG